MSYATMFKELCPAGATQEDKVGVFRGVMRSHSQHYRAEHAQAEEEVVLNMASLQETLAAAAFSDVPINNFKQAMELNMQKEKALVKRLRYCLQSRHTSTTRTFRAQKRPLSGCKTALLMS